MCCKNLFQENHCIEVRKEAFVVIIVDAMRGVRQIGRTKKALDMLLEKQLSKSHKIILPYFWNSLF